MEVTDRLLIAIFVYVAVIGVISVSAQSRNFVVAPAEVRVTQGEKAVLPCLLDPTQNAFVIWRRLNPNVDISIGVMLDSNLDPDFKERAVVVVNKGSGEYNLQISDARVSDEGTYECFVVSGPSATVRNPVQLHVFVPPEDGFPICDVNPSIPLQLGRTVTMSCTTKGGHPPSKVVWHRSQNPITVSGINAQQVNWTLTEQDFGVQFTCVESHPALQSLRQCSVVPLPFKLSVDLEPTIGQVDAGGKTSFTCVGKGSIESSLDFSWHVNKEPVSAQSGWIVSGNRGQILTIYNASISNNQTGITCTVTAGPGQSVKTYALLIVHEGRNTRTLNNGMDSPPTTRTVFKLNNHLKNNSRTNSFSRKLVIIISFGAVILGVVIGATIAIASIYRSRKVGAAQHRPRSFRSSFKLGSSKNGSPRSASRRLVGKQNRAFSTQTSRLWRPDSRRITFNDTQITFADPVLDYDDPPGESMSTDPEDSYLGLCPDSLSSSKYEDLHSNVMSSFTFDRFYCEAPATTEMEYEDVITDRNWSTRSYPLNRNSLGDSCLYLNRTSVP